MKPQILLLYFTFILCLSSCNNQDEENYLNEKIGQSMKTVYNTRSRYIKLRLDSITNFAWDSVYYFTSDISERHISKTIGFSWIGPHVPSHAKRLLFVHKGKVVKFADFYKCDSYVPESEDMCMPLRFLTCKSARTAYSKEEARFAVSKHCEESRIEFQFVPLDCLNSQSQEVLHNGCDTTSFSTESILN